MTPCCVQSNTRVSLFQCLFRCVCIMFCPILYSCVSLPVSMCMASCFAQSYTRVSLFLFRCVWHHVLSNLIPVCVSFSAAFDVYGIMAFRRIARLQSEGTCLTHVSLQWHNNDCDGVSNHQRLDCTLNRLFMRISNIEAPRHWSLWGEFTGDRWIPHTKGQ